MFMHSKDLRLGTLALTPLVRYCLELKENFYEPWSSIMKAFAMS